MTDTTRPPALRLALFQYGVRFPVYDEIFAALTDTLRQAGASVRTVEAVSEVHSDRDDLFLIVGTPNHVDNLLPGLTALRRQADRRVRVFLWHLEHLPDPDTPEPVLWALLLKNWLEARRSGGRYGNSRAANYHTIRKATRLGLFDQVFAFTPRKAQFLQQHGVPAEYLPAGYHPIWGTPGSEERDIDVLFLGEVLDDRRGHIVKAVRAALERENVALKTMYDFNPIGLWGEERNALLRRSKIYLSVYRHAQDFSGTRFCLGMGNGALIVSEPIADPYPFVPGRHFVQAAVPDLGRTILTYLRDEAGRVRICREATRLITEEYTMLASAQRIVARAHELGMARL